jgi:hypothetical protein
MYKRRKKGVIYWMKMSFQIRRGPGQGKVRGHRGGSWRTEPLSTVVPPASIDLPSSHDSGDIPKSIELCVDH